MLPTLKQKQGLRDRAVGYNDSNGLERQHHRRELAALG
jgi:hypothetical protein